MAAHNPADFHGLFPAAPTILVDGESLDEDAQRRLFRANADAGASGFWMFGSGGEGLTLDDSTRRRALEILFDELGNDFPVIAGISADGTKRTKERWEPIADLPVKGVFAVPPIYYGYSQEELYGYFVSLIEMTGKPVFPYHNPFFTKNRLSIDTMLRLARTDGIAGTKDSTTQIAETQRLIWETPDDFIVFQGQEELIAVSLALGATSIVSVVSASNPALFVDLIQTAKSGDLDSAWKKQREVNAYLAEIGTATAVNEGEFIGAVKRRLARDGFGSGLLTAPWVTA
ncbi:dihydrodipicolinate synthase family protein [Specibacter cremeus]|uniref:dihydrodipicolinate synthase family protein n=1 Tax=Specibacter cremeus TaxID=1629051 RepID=UPI000F77FECE|nr:dihydrodipicolinate synthase family protein [Specibacter cremeus]